MFEAEKLYCDAHPAWSAGQIETCANTPTHSLVDHHAFFRAASVRDSVGAEDKERFAALAYLTGDELGVRELQNDADYREDQALEAE
jgi:hydrogenase maturation factor HypF (carbamoyltransferase family)